jgi:hypothetical protein
MKDSLHVERPAVFMLLPTGKTTSGNSQVGKGPPSMPGTRTEKQPATTQ